MLRKIIPSRKHEVLASEAEADAIAHREALMRELAEQARNGGRAERDEFQRELDVWNAQRIAKTPSPLQPAVSIFRSN